VNEISDSINAGNFFISSVTVNFSNKTLVGIEVEVFWVVTPCSVVVGYKCFGGPCCLRFQGDVTGGNWLEIRIVAF
jgi:hypothetical protein